MNILTNQPFKASGTSLRVCALPESVATLQVVSGAKDNIREDDDVRWQPSGARQPERSGDSRRQTAKGNPQSERGGVHQCGVPPKGNANFDCVQHLIA
jgi:hypothetical protein